MGKMLTERRLKRFGDDPPYRFLAAVLFAAVDDVRGGHSRTPEINRRAREWFQQGDVGGITFRACADAFGMGERELRTLLSVEPIKRAKFAQLDKINGFERVLDRLL